MRQSRRKTPRLTSHARILQEDPDAIEQLHESYFEAGAGEPVVSRLRQRGVNLTLILDIATTCSYQASRQRFIEQGLTPELATSLMRLSISLAVQARDAYLRANPDRVRPKPLIAASMGNYGAFLADGSEYTGNYPNVTEEQISAFHIERAKIFLSEPGVDILAFETVPCLLETKAIAQACSADPVLSRTPAWVSFSCSTDTDDGLVSHGEKLSECIDVLKRAPNIVGVGINCIDPTACEALVKCAVNAAQGLTVICYANSGEQYDSQTKEWAKDGEVGNPDWYAGMASRWVDAGAKVIGGCCRTRPQYIKAIIQHVRNKQNQPIT